MIEISPTFVKLPADLLLAQGELKAVFRDAQNPHFKSRYATLENVIDAAKPALQAHFLAFVQAPGSIVDGSLEMTTMLIHASGEWMRSTMHIPLAKKDPQGVGSACTYGARYSLMAMLGIPPTDDDGEAAMDRSEPAKQKPVYSPPPRKANGLPEKGWREDGSRTSYWLKNNGSVDGLKEQLYEDAVDCHSLAQLESLKDFYRGKAKELKWNRQFLDVLTEEFANIERSILNTMDAAELAEVPLDTALKHSIQNHPLNAG